MKSILIRLTAVCVLITATISAGAQKFSNAIELNEYLVTITDTLYMGGQEWGTKLNAAIKTKDFASLAPSRKKMEYFIESKQKELKEMKDSWGSESLRLAVLDFLAYEKILMVEAFAPLEKYNKNSTNEEIQAALAQIQKLAEKEGVENRKVAKAQNDFALKNGFTIEED